MKGSDLAILLGESEGSIWLTTEWVHKVAGEVGGEVTGEVMGEVGLSWD